MMKRLLLLGASGSIGTQTLDLLNDSSEYELTAFSVGTQIDKIDGVLRRFPSVKWVSLLDENAAETLRNKYPDIVFFGGKEGAAQLAKEADYDTAVNAIVGFAGLRPTLEVLERGKILCLANKESLVVGGRLVKKLLKEKGGRLYPIDSEHAAIAKCLATADKPWKKIILTASGGPFRNTSLEDMKSITPEMALNHPTWKMGKKITIDSSTLMNKGFEVIEACYLFDVDPSDIQVVVHPESLVHSGLLLEDGSYIVDYGKPDMHGPIAYALSEGKKIEGIKKVGRLEDLEGCHFENLDNLRFPGVQLAISAYIKGGDAGAVLNGANEMAVSLFLEGKISYLDIVRLTGLAIEKACLIKNPTYHELAQSDAWARNTVLELSK